MDDRQTFGWFLTTCTLLLFVLLVVVRQCE